MNEDEERGPAGERQTRRPGHELCAARERAGISREEIARTLHLPEEQVDALEDDNYARLPPPAYVRGYLRAYAREVGLDADELVAEFDVVAGEKREPELVIHMGQPEPGAGRGPLVAFVIVIAVALIGAVAWWVQQPALAPIELPGGTAPDAAEPAAVQPEESATIEPAEPVEPTAPEAPESSASLDATQPVADEPAAGADEPAAATGETSTTTDEAATDATLAETAAPEPAAPSEAGEGDADGGTEEPVPESMVAEGDRPTATDQAELVPTLAATSGPDRLIVDIDGASWLEVFDSRGRQLAYTLYSGDEPVVLNGYAPFDVFLGNAPAVTLRIEDREIDHSAFVRSDNTARFLVDSQGARRR